MTEEVVKNNMYEEALSEESSIGAEPDDLEALQKALADEKEKAQKYLANWQRAQADFSNFKKRNEQEKAETIKFANAALISSLLPALDDLERALDNVPSEIAGSNWVEGIEMIYRKLLTALEGQGLSKIEAEGEDFDPNVHQAVLNEEGVEGKVMGELQKGYMLRDRLLRPAMVKVGKGKSKN
ncbi:MAG: nucleotide exchange factor GrpE [Dehalococcoidia bacterium]